MELIKPNLGEIEIKDVRKKQTQKNYDGIAELYAADFENDNRGFDSLINPLVSNLDENNLENAVVDLGTGPGNVVDYLLKLGIKNKIIGVDFTKKFCDNSIIKYSNKQQVDIVFDDFVDYVSKQPNDSISAYISSYSIIHIPDEEIDGLFENIERSLQKKGMAAFLVYEGTQKGMEQEPYQKEEDSRLKITEKLESYSNCFEIEELKERLTKVGLKVIKINNPEMDFIPGEYQQPKIFVLAQKE